MFKFRTSDCTWACQQQQQQHNHHHHRAPLPSSSALSLPYSRAHQVEAQLLLLLLLLPYCWNPNLDPKGPRGSCCWPVTSHQLTTRQPWHKCRLANPRATGERKKRHPQTRMRPGHHRLSLPVTTCIPATCAPPELICLIEQLSTPTELSGLVWFSLLPSPDETDGCCPPITMIVSMIVTIITLLMVTIIATTVGRPGCLIPLSDETLQLHCVRTMRGQCLKEAQANAINFGNFTEDN